MTAHGMCGRLEIYESARHLSNSNRDVRFEFESNVEASQVPTGNARTPGAPVLEIRESCQFSRLQVITAQIGCKLNTCQTLKYRNAPAAVSPSKERVSSIAGGGGGRRL